MNRNLIASAVILAATVSANAQDLPRVSPKTTLAQGVGLSEVSVTYSRPAVKGRTIWGALVPFDQVWRTGANEATTIKLSDDAKINGETLKAGTYSLHTIPGRENWTLIFNSVADQWGSYSYKKESDVLRVNVTPKSAEFTELLTFATPRVTTTHADFEIRWDRLAVPFTVEFDTAAKTLASIDKAIAATPNDWRVYFRAAQWAFDNGQAPRGNEWLTKSRSIEESWSNMSLHARMLAKSGDRKGAVAAGNKALELAKKATNKPDTSAFEAEMKEWQKK